MFCIGSREKNDMLKKAKKLVVLKVIDKDNANKIAFDSQGKWSIKNSWIERIHN